MFESWEKCCCQRNDKTRRKYGWRSSLPVAIPSCSRQQWSSLIAQYYLHYCCLCRALLLLLLSSGREQCYGSRRLIQGQLLLTLSYCPSQVFAEAQKDTVQAPGTIQPRSFYLRDDDIDLPREGSPIGGRSCMHARKPGWLSMMRTRAANFSTVFFQNM